MARQQRGHRAHHRRHLPGDQPGDSVRGVFVAIGFNGRIPTWMYRPIELTIIVGVVFPFQPLHFELASVHLATNGQQVMTTAAGRM